MKKLLFVFAVVFVVVLVAGCKARQNKTVEFDTDSTTTVVTPIEEGAEAAANPLEVALGSGDTSVLADTTAAPATPSTDQLPGSGLPLALPLSLSFLMSGGLLTFRKRK